MYSTTQRQLHRHRCDAREMCATCVGHTCVYIFVYTMYFLRARVPLTTGTMHNANRPRHASSRGAYPRALACNGHYNMRCAHGQAQFAGKKIYLSPGIYQRCFNNTLEWTLAIGQLQRTYTSRFYKYVYVACV